MSTMRSIGRLSAETGVKITTIRYYESVGLTPTPARTPSGRRVYGSDAVERLSFIRHARDLGFGVEAIRELIALQTDPDRDCAKVDQIAQRRLADVERRIVRLQALCAELARMISQCKGGAVSDCQVMASLNDHGLCQTRDHLAPDEALSS